MHVDGVREFFVEVLGLSVAKSLFPNGVPALHLGLLLLFFLRQAVRKFLQPRGLILTPRCDGLSRFADRLFVCGQKIKIIKELGGDINKGWQENK